MPAFDTLNPPEPDLIDTCVHCGFCLPTCPTYVLWSEEMDSPRGRILLMRAGHEEDGPMTLAQVNAWDNCLGCMACVTACPSGVRFGSLLEATRAQLRRSPRAGRVGWLERLIFALFPRPERLGLAMRANTQAQAELHETLISSEAWRIIEIASAHGAAGWKVNGAGGEMFADGVCEGRQLGVQREELRERDALRRRDPAHTVPGLDRVEHGLKPRRHVQSRFGSATR